MTEPRRVTCPACGFQAQDRGNLGLPVLTGDIDLYLHLCRRLDDAPPPARMFHCGMLRTAARRAAIAAEIETSRELGS